MSAIKITKDNFKTEVLDAAEPVLLDFWAAWCGPCRMLSPVVDEAAGTTPGVRVGKINVDEEPELAAQFGVMSIPSLVVMQGGKPVQTSVGVIPKAAILRLLGR